MIVTTGQATLDRVRDLIGDRLPVVVVPGPSIALLRPVVPLLRHLPLAWCGIPKWWYIERELLAPHGTDVEMVWTGCELTIRSEATYLRDLVRRPRGLLVTKTYGLEMGVARTPLVHYDKRVAVFDMEDHVNALGGIILTLRYAGYDRVALFGADGCTGPGGEQHFGEAEYRAKWDWYQRDADMARLRSEAIRLDAVLSRLLHAMQVINFTDGRSVLSSTEQYDISIAPEILEGLTA